MDEGSLPVAEVGAAVAWLATREASYVTGQVIVVDGGNSIAEELALLLRAVGPELRAVQVGTEEVNVALGEFVRPAAALWLG